MLRFALAAALAIALAGSVSACGFSLEDEGPRTVQTRPVGSFDRVVVHGSAHVVVRPGRGGRLRLDGGRNRVADLLTRVRAGTLVISPRDPSAIDLGGGHVDVVARAPAIDGYEVVDSGEVRLVGFRR